MENNTEIGSESKKNDEEKGIKKFLSFSWELLKIALIALVIVLPIRYFLFQPFIVKGESMMPNFKSGDYLIVDEISYRLSEPARGDVIVFRYPRDTSQKFIKRVIGLPGETVDIKEGKVLITKPALNVAEGDGNTSALDEAYLPDNLKTFGDVKVLLGSDEYFVLGDNREYSFDSRSWGIVPRKNIIGKAFLRIFPMAALSQISSPAY